ncbi:MAG TPA: LysR family transcriptional regulator [Kiloniellales bacterium]|nr:LysR family transcriptional regulator [Kiloniellales bacterium]
MDSLNAMEVFVRVVQSGSFSEAARALSLTPSAVSKQVSRLEDRLGARLINRTTRRLGLTEEGTAFFDRAQRILADVSEAEQAVTRLHGAPRGTLKLNAPVVFGRMHIAPLIPAFLAQHREVRIDFTVNDRFVDLLEEGLDLVIRIGELKDSSLIARRLATNRRVVVASQDYLEKHGRPERPRDLAAHNCLIYLYRSTKNLWQFDGPEGPESVEVRGDVETNNAEVILELVRAGQGIALLPTWLVGQCLRQGYLQQVLKGYAAADSQIYAVYPPGRHLSPKVRAFVDHLVQHFKASPLWREMQ